MKRCASGVILALLPVMTGCISHTRKLQRPTAPAIVQTVQPDQLAKMLQQRYEEIRSLRATVEFQASVGGSEKGKITEYTSFRGYVLMRKPALLRVLGLVPVLHTRAFDMASDGNVFKLIIPPKNRAITGPSNVTTKSKNSIENFRPSLFLDALLIKGVEENNFYSVTSETKTEVSSDGKGRQLVPEYEMTEVSKSNDSKKLITLRVVRFHRDDLLPYEQDMYDEKGDLETSIVYGPYLAFGDQKYPGTITIKRPQEFYQLVLTMQKLVLNQELADDQFQMELPANMPVEQLK